MSQQQRNELFAGASSTNVDSSSSSTHVRSSLNDNPYDVPPAQTSLSEALQTGQAIAEALDGQTQQLNNAKELGENETYLLTKSDRILRGMGSWGGWAYNTFVKSASSELRRSSAPPKPPTRNNSMPPSAPSMSLSKQRTLVQQSGSNYSLPNAGPSTRLALDALNAYKINLDLFTSSSGPDRKLLEEILEELWAKFRTLADDCVREGTRE
eukprot:CAMPEP_0118639308 /NCGR_PEP_ID=MMETSP0785-20121206/4152_1 /TAXON_ID=91992 /ORGANISM="Bolidomonas pacifica, Strain CCMP 1866" /LENGTH=210 /DNA_ID=CAMNT_0006530623 /DNA_START=91 /DNA_END=720 /DNA_ORIENTATION=+